MKFVKCEKIDYVYDVRKINNKRVIDYTTKQPIKISGGRISATVQADTDSNYYCFDEMFQMVKSEIPNLDDMRWFYCSENMFNRFWAEALKKKADYENIEQLIIFNRENMFSHFLSWGKKAYIGAVVDKEGKYYGYKHWKPKITGITLTKTESSAFTKKYAKKLVFDVAAGLSRKDTDKRIIEYFEMFKKEKPENIANIATCGTTRKYIHKSMKEMLETGLGAFDKCPISTRIAVCHNFYCAKNQIPIEPIQDNDRFYHIKLEANRYGFDAIGFKEWNERFDLPIDYETTYRKFFLAIIDRMYNCLGWKSENDIIPIRENKANRLFKKK
ncbi:MAG: hypothetical protein MJZ34_04770 [Paludibacteraceae bacterium]|nr:hypothetical protein [Paludibacteraceae bacterium]